MSGRRLITPGPAFEAAYGDAGAVVRGGVCGRVRAPIRPAATIVIIAGLLEPEMEVDIDVMAALA